MSNDLTIALNGAEASGGDGGSSSPIPFHGPQRRQEPAPEPEVESPADPGQRLMIEEIGDTGQFLYTVIDRASGEVVAKASREEVTQMSLRSDYSAGALIRAKA